MRQTFQLISIGLASLKFTIVGLLVLALAVIAYIVPLQGANFLITIALFLLAVNLLFSMAIRPVFRRQLPLLMFHFSLLLLIVLLALGRTTYLKGRVELAQGEVFAGDVLDIDSGYWHTLDFDGFWFINSQFNISYGPYVNRKNTYNTISWGKGSEQFEDAIIGDQHPLVLNGYRFYTTSNKGFSAIFDWKPEMGEGQVLRGAVNFPSYPAKEFEQVKDWLPPGQSKNLWTMLVLEEEIKNPEKPFAFRVPEKHSLVIRYNDERLAIRPGDSISLEGGELHYVELRQWMGYKVFYDWTRAWILATILICIVSIAWHYYRKFFSRPWLEEADEQPSFSL